MPENNQPPTQYNDRPAPYRDYDDEISLVDLWLVLAKRKLLIGAIIAISAGVGLYIALSTPKKYEYSTVIEIGNRVVNDDIKLLEDANTLKAKIEQSFIPLAQQRYINNHPDEKKIYNLKVSVPDKSTIVRVSGEGPSESREPYFSLLNQVVESVKKDHARLFDVIRKDLDVKRNVLLNKKAELADAIGLLKSKQARLEKKSSLLEERIRDVRQLIQAGLENRRRAVQETKDATHAMTLLMIDNEIQQNRRRLDDLEEELYIQLSADQDSLKKQLADKLREQSNVESQIDEIELQIQNLQATRAIVGPMQSLKPVGPNRKLILVLSVIIGALVGIFVAFFMEFLGNVKNRQRAEA